jgi:hypothetical protein
MNQEAYFTTDGKTILNNYNEPVKFISAAVESRTISEASLKKLEEEKVNLLHWKILWSDVEKTDEEEYDENYLAQLRDELKKLEEKNIWVIINWDFTRPEWGGDELINGIEAAKHTARRLKDCKKIIGFEICGESSVQLQAALADALTPKHKHYLYFAQKPESSQFLPAEILL